MFCAYAASQRRGWHVPGVKTVVDPTLSQAEQMAVLIHEHTHAFIVAHTTLGNAAERCAQAKMSFELAPPEARAGETGPRHLSMPYLEQYHSISKWHHEGFATAAEAVHWEYSGFGDRNTRLHVRPPDYSRAAAPLLALLTFATTRLADAGVRPTLAAAIETAVLDALAVVLYSVPVTNEFYAAALRSDEALFSVPLQSVSARADRLLSLDAREVDAVSWPAIERCIRRSDDLLTPEGGVRWLERRLPGPGNASLRLDILAQRESPEVREQLDLGAADVLLLRQELIIALAAKVGLDVEQPAGTVWDDHARESNHQTAGLPEISIPAMSNFVALSKLADLEPYLQGLLAVARCNGNDVNLPADVLVELSGPLRDGASCIALHVFLGGAHEATVLSPIVTAAVAKRVSEIVAEFVEAAASSHSRIHGVVAQHGSYELGFNAECSGHPKVPAVFHDYEVAESTILGVHDHNMLLQLKMSDGATVWKTKFFPGGAFPSAVLTRTERCYAWVLSNGLLARAILGYGE